LVFENPKITNSPKSKQLLRFRIIIARILNVV
jgi:hypothetical protein